VREQVHRPALTERIVVANDAERPTVARYRSWGWGPTTTK
jgi:hypothetical protein